MTIRDSPQYFINVSRWGTLDVLSKEAESLQIGDVGEYILAKDILKNFNPTVGLK